MLLFWVADEILVLAGCSLVRCRAVNPKSRLLWQSQPSLSLALLKFANIWCGMLKLFSPHWMFWTAFWMRWNNFPGFRRSEYSKYLYLCVFQEIAHSSAFELLSKGFWRPDSNYPHSPSGLVHSHDNNPPKIWKMVLAYSLLFFLIQLSATSVSARTVETTLGPVVGERYCLSSDQRIDAFFLYKYSVFCFDHISYKILKKHQQWFEESRQWTLATTLKSPTTLSLPFPLLLRQSVIHI